MRFEHEGRSLWFGTADAPAPDLVPAGEEAVITIGVWPVDPSNRVELLYRVNQGAVKNVAATWFRNDSTGKAQYFRVRLQGFQAGDVVEYIPVCGCAGRQVPGPEDAKKFASSFTVSETNLASTGPTGSAAPVIATQKRTLEVAASAITESQAIAPPAQSVLLRPRPNGSPVTATLDPIGPPQPAPLPSDPLRDKTLEYAKLAGLDQHSANKLLEKNLTFAQLNRATLSGLAGEGVLTESQTAELELTLELGKLTGDNLPFVRSIKNKGVKSTLDLIGWEKAQWQQLITHERIDLPRGETTESYSEKILLNLNRAYPSQSLFNGLLANWQARLSLLDSPAKPPQQAELTAFANKYRHLGTIELLNDKNADASQKKKAIAGRLQLLDAFYQNNQHLDLRSVNFFKSADTDTFVNWGSIPMNDRPMVRKQLMAYQRVLNLADSDEDRQALLSKGYDSAFAIAGKTETEFMQTSGLTSEKAGAIYSTSQENALRVCLDCGAIREVAGGPRVNIAVNNLPERLINDLRDIDGFDDLFGPQDFCDCEGCKSILGPAAYFVDLMSFIEREISNPVFVTLIPTGISGNDNRTSSPLYLKNRRPDLWDLQLTCENTHALVPYLTIVNEVLEAYLRVAVPGDIFANLSRRDLGQISFGVPFNLPLVELRLYLKHFGFTLYDIYRTLRLDETTIWRERLKLSKEEFYVIENADHNGVKLRFGDPVSLDDFYVNDYKNAALAVDRRGFINYAGISRQQLDELLTMRFNSDLHDVMVEQQTLPGELQNFPEILKNLTNERLDFVHRFIRLWKKTEWSIPQLDLVLFTMQQAGLTGPNPNDIPGSAVLYFARLIDMQEKLKLTVEEACAFVDESPVPTTGPPRFFASLPVSREFPRPPAKHAERMLFERLFDLKTLFEGVPLTAEPQFQFRHFSLDRRESPDLTIDPKTPILLGGIGLSETELLLLFELLKAHMPFDGEGKTMLDRPRISLLYRHARLAKALRLNIDDFIQSLRLNFAADSLVITRLDQVEQLIKFRDWLKQSPFTVPELRFVLKGEESTAVKFKTNLETAGAVVVEVQKTQPAANTAAERVELLKSSLAKSFNLTAGRLDDMLHWISLDVSSTAIETALNTTFVDADPAQPNAPPDLDALQVLMGELERVLLLFDSLKFNEDSITYLTKNPAKLDISNLKALTLENLKALTFYKKMLTLHDDAPALLHTLLEKLPSQPFTEVELMADLWRQDLSLIKSVVNSPTLPSVPIEAIEHLSKRLSICQRLGINGHSLQKLADDSDFAKLIAARNVALGAFSSKYDDEKMRREKLEPYEDQINVIKRDALCDYIIAREKVLNFKDRSDIYAFFLLDVEMSGCFRTSRVVAAVSALQLYVHRVLANLEQSVSDANLLVLPPVAERERFKREWEWRKNYRVWEANRKVFLYPENYIEPDLRDNKTPLFKQLEDELLQEKITKESAEEAYKKYIAQFAELTRLKIAGSYCDAATNTYHFFGRSQQDPPRYYYRKWDTRVWTAWEEIPLGINASRVSAVVRSGRLFLFWVEVNVREVNKVIGGSSFFEKYSFECTFNYSFLKEDGKWAAANKLKAWFSFPEPAPAEDSFSEAKKWKIERLIALRTGEQALFDRASDSREREVRGDNLDNLINQINQARKEAYEEVADSIKTLEDARKQAIVEAKAFLKCYPLVRNNLFLEYVLQGSSHFGRLDFFSNTFLEAQSELTANPEKQFVKLYSSVGSNRWLVLDEIQNWTEGDADSHLGGLQFIGSPGNRLTDAFSSSIHKPSITVVHGSLGDGYIFTSADQDFLIHGLDTSDATVTSERAMVRLGTTLADELGRKLFDEGLISFLSLDTQKEIERPLGINFIDPTRLSPPVDDPDHIDFTGAYGEYYRELFFHIPFLIASHLNANQKFAEARWWFERIFDPTNSEPLDPQWPNDRNWRYVEFRELEIKKMIALLNDDAAIQRYKEDPFNPHAIARLRLNAYQKAIVMKYIDNLIDWGDHLFAQDTMESINEATMLYVLAADILGKRPAKLGKCKTAPEQQLTYEKLLECPDPQHPDCSEFLVYLENWHTVNTRKIFQPSFSGHGSTSGSFIADPSPIIAGGSGSLKGSSTGFSGSERSRSSVTHFSSVGAGKARFSIMTKWGTPNAGSRFPNFDLTTQSTLAFCVPPNYDLMKYWDRVEDRLFKIRHCMNISGVRRQLALFQPPIDPMALVRARAAGLSLEDILGMLAAPAPFYRFNYLIEKAKQFTQTVQSFGSTLLSALEKKDVEELTLLRSLHERNILGLTKEIKKQQLTEAQFQYQSMVETKANVKNRVDYYLGLVDEGLTEWESVQQVTKHASSTLKLAESVVHLMAGITYLIPQIGNPFAMKYGGKELGDSGVEFAQWTSSLSAILETVSASAGLEATFQRREQEWNQQLLLAQQELKQVEQQRLAAEVRRLIAEKDLEIHEKNIEQADELHEFYKNKFTNLGLYNYLSTSLTRLYREAYNVAHDMAKLAERAYQFERGDDTALFIAGDNWQFDRAGLLAGERLMLQLQRLEKAFLQHHTRDYEVNQSFSLALMNPAALLSLRETGSCEFTIPEIWFDLFYPGQYRRVIKSVRLSIPCVAGPYTNVSGKLTLKNYKLRKTAATGPLDVIVANPSTSIATSNGQNDGGLFELNFRDERYLPFEGAGAVDSTWGLELPSAIRLFDYDTISDVILHVSYTARDGGSFKDTIETEIVNTLSEFASTNGLSRLLSLKHEFPNTLHRLLNTPGVEQTFVLTERHFPYFLTELVDPSANGSLAISGPVVVYIKPKGAEPVATTTTSLNIADLAVENWEPFGTLSAGMVSVTGTPLREWQISAGNDLQTELIDDVLILLKYEINF